MRLDNFRVARQASMIALNGDEIGGLPSTQDLPFAEFLAGLTRTRGSVLFFPSRDTRTLCQVAYKKVRLSGMGSEGFSHLDGNTHRDDCGVSSAYV